MSDPFSSIPEAKPASEEVTLPHSAVTNAGKLPGAAAAPSVTIPGYDILAELGRGGMGVVYKAHHTQLNRFVALKMILSGGHASSLDIERFLHEAEAVAAFSHPYVVQVYEVGQQQNLPYMALEFVDGDTLAERLRYGPLPLQEAAQLVERLSAGMNAAHQAGIVHRDLKPANVLLGKDGTPKITDFGLARRVEGVSDITQTGAIVGTPSYMAPEQAAGQGKRVGPAADLYSLGAILYECLTGRPPFKGATPVATMQLILTEEVVPPRRLRPPCPADLETICLKCLQKEPGKRYGSAEALAEDLRRWQQHEPIAARPAGRWERLWRSCKRHPVVATSCFLTTLVVAALIFAGFMSSQRSHAEAERRLAEQTRDLLLAEQQRTTDALARAETAYQQEATLRAQLVQLSYLHQVGIAHREWRDANVGLARTLLEGCAKGLRGWEWHYLARLCSPASLRLEGHKANIWSVAWSRTGKHIATASSDGTVRLWDAATGRELRQWTGLGAAAWGVAISPDGNAVAACGQQAVVVVWDANDGRELKRLEGFTAAVNAVAFSPDGKQLACGTGTITRPGIGADSQTPGSREVRVYDWRSGTVVHELRGHSRSITVLTWSPDGAVLASAGWDASICLWNAATGTLTRRLLGHQYNIRGLAFSPDSQRLASSCEGRTVRLWDVRLGATRWLVDDWKAGVSDVAFDPEGRTLACISSDQTIRLLTSTTGKTRLTLRGHSSWGLGLAFNPTGERLVSVGADRVGKVWDLHADPEAQVLSGHVAWVNGVAFSNDGTSFASAATGGVQLRQTGKPALVAVAALPGAAVNGVRFSPDDRLLAGACSDGTICLWDAKTTRLLHQWRAHVQQTRDLAFSPDGQLLASVGFDHQLRLWSLPERKLVALLGEGTRSVAFSADGKYIAAAGSAAVVRVWEASTRRLVHSLAGHEGVVVAVAFSRDGRRLVSGGTDRTVRLWDPTTGRQQWVFRGHTEAVLSLAFSPDGSRLATASDDRLVKVLVTATGEEALNLPGHLGPVYAVAFSPDGCWLASAGWDSTARLWNGTPGREKP